MGFGAPIDPARPLGEVAHAVALTALAALLLWLAFSPVVIPCP